MSLILPKSPFSDMTEEVSYDANNDSMIIKTTQDVEPHFNRNKEILNAGVTDRNKPLRLFASIPMSVVMQIKTEYGIDVFRPEDNDRLMKLLHTREFRKLKCLQGTYL